MKKRLQKLISVIITLCIIAGLVPLFSVPANAFAGGTGASGNPFRIETLAQLQTFRNNVNNGTTYNGQFIRLDANITLTGTNNWTPIGINNNHFQGTFNGNGHTISGVHINSSVFQRGLFGVIGGNAVVENIGLINSTIIGTESVGGIAGRNIGIVQNSYVMNSTITGTSETGGIVGSNSRIIRNCFSNATVSGNFVGGIAGSNDSNNSSITFCYALGTVQSTNNNAGGIVGITWARDTNATVANCVALQTSIISGGANVGRIFGTGTATGTRSNNRARDSGMTLRFNTNQTKTPTSSLTGVDGGNVTIGTTANSTVFSGWNTSIWNIPSGNLNMSNLPTFQPLRTVTYNGNGNTGGSAPIDNLSPYINNSTVTVLGTGNLTKTGHTFSGWGTTADGETIRAPGSTFTITANTTLFAQWSIITPTAATATNYGKTYFTANWNNTGADSYLLDVATDSNFTNMVTGYSGFSVTGTSQTVTGLEPDTEYFYRVRAVAGGNISENSNIVNVRTASVNREAIVIDQTTNFTVDSDNLQYILDNHIVTDEDIANNNSVTLTLTVKETDDTADGAESIIELSQGRLLQFFEITVEKQINNEEPVPLSELPVPVEVTIDLSSELSGKSGYTVYRYHNGVQRIGTDTDADEYFTIRRGGGAGNVDQVVIYARNFSTYAVVENIVTLHSADSHEDVDVQARIVDSTTPVYKIDITWGNMKFVYNLTGSVGTWNPETASYDNPIAAGWNGVDGENNKITVTNQSNADVLVGFDVAAYFDNSGDVKLSVETEHDGIRRVLISGAEALYIEAFLMIEGEPSQTDIDNMNGDTWHRIGIITVTITPDGDTLTPR